MTNPPLDTRPARSTAAALAAVALGVILALTVILQALPATSSRAADAADAALPAGLGATSLGDLALPVFVVGAVLALVLVAGALIAGARAPQRH